jgi:hypothetical protein
MNFVGIREVANEIERQTDIHTYNRQRGKEERKN